MDTPYRLVALMKDIASVFGSSRRLCVAFDLTLPDEEICHGTAVTLAAEFERAEKKGEFVIIIEGSNPQPTTN